MKINIPPKKQIIIYLSSIFLMILLFNFLTPLLTDDFGYSFGKDGRIQNIVDIVIYQKWHYFNWGGRTVAHFIAQIFLILPKWVFNICNSLVYVALVYLIYLHAKGDKETNPIMIPIIHLFLWFSLPVFGQTFLWLIGSCNYLWTSVIILAFLLPFRQNIDRKDSPMLIIRMFLIGIIAGWTNENTAFGLIISIALLILHYKKSKAKNKIKKWHISGLVGAIIGFVIMILAPGNFVRKDVVIDNTFFIVKWIYRVLGYTYTLVEFLLPCIVIIVVATSIKIYKKQKIEIQSYIYLIASILCVYSMVLSPEFPERAWTGVFVFIIIATVSIIFNLEKISKVFKYVFIDAIIIFGIIYARDYLQATEDINQLRNTWEYRNNYIKSERKKNNKSIELGEYTTYNRYNPAFGLSDIEEDKDHWANKLIAKYYKIDSIKQKQDRDETNE